MKSFRWKVPLMTLTALMAALVVVTLAVNLWLNRYMEDQARQAIEQTRLELLGERRPVRQASGFTPLEVNLLFVDTDFYMRDGYGAPHMPGLNPLETALLAHLRQSDAKPSHILPLTLEGQQVFTAYQPLMLDEYSSESELAVIYANISPMKDFSRRLNQLFMLTALLSAVIASIAGALAGARLDDTQSRLKRFFQNASHELKTPLMTIQGYAEGIHMGLIPPAEGGQVILEEGERMAALTEEILALSRLDSGAITLKKERLNLGEALFATMHHVQATATRKGIALDPYIPDETIWIMGDEAQLGKAVSNLLTNALRHGNKQVSLKLFKQGGDAIIRVQDDGPGISQEDQKHIFERFYAGAGGATGIGLALALEIVRLHQGKITAANDQGACFTIRLPLA